MLTAALVSLSVVFVAELGDKSQLMTMTYALRHRWVVLSGVGIASFMVERGTPCRPSSRRTYSRICGS